MASLDQSISQWQLGTWKCFFTGPHWDGALFPGEIFPLPRTYPRSLMSNRAEPAPAELISFVPRTILPSYLFPPPPRILHNKEEALGQVPKAQLLRTVFLQRHVCGDAWWEMLLIRTAQQPQHPFTCFPENIHISSPNEILSCFKWFQWFCWRWR